MIRRIGTNKRKIERGRKLKKFVEAKIEIIKLDEKDIILTSIGGGIALPDKDIGGEGTQLPDTDIGGGGTTLPDVDL